MLSFSIHISQHFQEAFTGTVKQVAVHLPLQQPEVHLSLKPGRSSWCWSCPSSLPHRDRNPTVLNKSQVGQKTWLLRDSEPPFCGFIKSSIPVISDHFYDELSQVVQLSPKMKQYLLIWPDALICRVDLSPQKCFQYNPTGKIICEKQLPGVSLP